MVDHVRVVVEIVPDLVDSVHCTDHPLYFISHIGQDHFTVNILIASLSSEVLFELAVALKDVVHGAR